MGEKTGPSSNGQKPPRPQKKRPRPSRLVGWAQ
jgi:hypothetical protein